MWKRLIIVGIIMAVFLGGLAYFQLVFKPQMIEQFVSQMQGAAPTVTTEKARSEDWSDKVQAIGTVTAVKGVNLAPEIAGVVADYHFESGDDVEQGKLLVQLDDSVQQAELRANKAALKEAELAFERQESLVGKGAASQAALDTATSNRDTAAAAVDQVAAVIAQKKVLAPFSGRLGLRNVERGQYVSAGQGLVWLQMLDPIWIDFPVPESQAAKLALNDAVEVRSDAFPGQIFTGHVEALDTRVNADTRTLMVRAELPNKDKRLLPGMFANVAVSSGAPKSYVTVPRTAVTYSLYGDAVWVAKEKAPEEGQPKTADASAAGTGESKPQMVVERRFVRVGPTQGDRVAILEGVEAGEEVVTTGQLKLTPEGAINIDNSERLKAPPELPRS